MAEILNSIISFGNCFNKKKAPHSRCFVQSDPAGIRTQGPYIKSVLLYQLSYRICRFEGANIQLFFGYNKEIYGKFVKNIGELGK
jgi:hypothetical protein